MIETNPYNAYTEDTILNSDPIGLVIAMYEGALESSVTARNCLASRDIASRTKAVNKIVAILTELLRTLNDEKGGEISHNLRQLYAYIQGRVTDAHFRQDPAPLLEAEKLFSTLLDGWKGAQNNAALSLTSAPSTVVPARQIRAYHIDTDYSGSMSYGSYLPEMAEASSSSAYSF